MRSIYFIQDLESAAWELFYFSLQDFRFTDSTSFFTIWPAGIAGLSPKTLLAGMLVCRRQRIIARCRLVESEINFPVMLPLRG